MLLHHETFRLLVRERMDHYLNEAAVDRQTHFAAVGGAAPGFVRTASALLLAVARKLVPPMRERGAACGKPADARIESTGSRS